MSDEKIKAIVRRVPVNATAARVVGPGPKGLDLSNAIGEVCQAEPLPLRVPLPRGLRRDLTGKSVGWLTVVGLSIKPNRWVCRCRCGYYVLRSAKSIHKPSNQTVDRCPRCKQVVYLQNHSTFVQTGKNADEWDRDRKRDPGDSNGEV